MGKFKILVKHLEIFRRWTGMILAFLVLAGCARGTNFFKEMSDKTSDSAIYYDANKALETGAWTTAITAVGMLSTTWQAKRDVQVLLASAYAGRCGLDVLTMASNLASPAGGSSLFQVLFTAMNGATASSLADCVTAEQKLKTIWGSASPSASNPVKENVLMAFIALAKIGAVLNADGDVAPKDNTLDWTRLAASTNHPCDNGGGGDTALPAADASQIVTGFALMIQGFTAAGSTGSGSLATFMALCTSNAALLASGICTATDVASVTGAHRLAIRALLEETTDGIGLKIYNDSFANIANPINLLCLNGT